MAWLSSESPERIRSDLISLSLGGLPAFMDSMHADDQATLHETLEQVVSKWDLQEPFERIRETVSELQKAA